MTLREYVRKRRFDRTPEPGVAGGVAGKPRVSKRPIFVVQLHHASHRHYDFRLEIDGALKSWAVPKGPSLRPGEKRLAVEVEDHPLGYASFEGDIPEGQYGAGHVDIFDAGTWSIEGDAAAAHAAGKLDFVLHGQVLRGAWKLVRTAKAGSKPQWLLLKRDDPFAADAEADGFVGVYRRSLAKKPARAPARAQAKTAPRRDPRPAAGTRNAASIDWHAEALALPNARVLRDASLIGLQLATLADVAPTGDGWLHELKWDGYRLQSLVVGDQVALRSRKGLIWSNDFPSITDALRALDVPQAQFDGEMVAFDADGNVDFGTLQHALKGEVDAPLRYIVFDMPLLAGVDLTRAPLIARKALLERVLVGHEDGVLAYSRHVVGHGPRVFENSKRQEVEGIISKAVDAPYAPGRSRTWVKVKHVESDEFVVVGYTPGKGARAGLGAMMLAAREPDGTLRYVGRVGTGFDTAGLAEMTRRLDKLRRREPVVDIPAHVALPRRSITWVEPRVVVEVEYRGWGKEGLLRQGSFMRVRDDKPMQDLGGDRLMAGRPRKHHPLPNPPLEGEGVKKSSPSRGVLGGDGAASPRRRSKQATVPPGRISSPDKRLYPAAGITKGEVAAYYAQVAPLLLPEVVNRPLSLLRCPSGVDGQCFFQKHHADTFGAGVHAVPIAEKDGGTDDYLFIDEAEGLLDLVQMNTLELHPWGSRIAHIEQPDRLVFDLDPGPGVDWQAVCDGARTVRDRLAEIGLKSFVRLSGGKGLHVVVPIAPRRDWADAKAFCGGFAQALATLSPDRFVATASKAKRDGVIFVDWLRNGRGATSVCSWSLRARAAAGVAVPLAWDELDATRGGDDYPLARALERAASHGNRVWRGWDAAGRQVLPA